MYRFTSIFKTIDEIEIGSSIKCLWQKYILSKTAIYQIHYLLINSIKDIYDDSIEFIHTLTNNYCDGTKFIDSLSTIILFYSSNILFIKACTNIGHYNKGQKAINCMIKDINSRSIE